MKNNGENAAALVASREQIIEASGEALLAGFQPGDIEYDIALVRNLGVTLAAPAGALVAKERAYNNGVEDGRLIERSVIRPSSESAATPADLPEDRLNHIARQYFVSEDYQGHVKHAISDAFKEARAILATPTESAVAPVDWHEGERIANIPIVEDALHGFSEDPTGDNGICVVIAILDALATHQPTPTKGNGDTDKGEQA